MTFTFSFTLCTDSSQIQTIMEGFKAFHAATCIRFRPVEKDDSHWVQITGNYSGCWSSVGRRKGGQVCPIFLAID